MDTRCMKPKQDEMQKVRDGDVIDGSRLASKGCEHRAEPGCDRPLHNGSSASAEARKARRDDVENRADYSYESGARFGCHRAMIGGVGRGWGIAMIYWRI
jgi:hypothetical protein